MTLDNAQCTRLYDEFDFEDYETIVLATIDDDNCVHVDYVDERDNSIGHYHSSPISDERVGYILFGKKY